MSRIEQERRLFAARAAVLARYDWQRNLARISQCVDASPALGLDPDLPVVADVDPHGPTPLREVP